MGNSIISGATCQETITIRIRRFRTRVFLHLTGMLKYDRVQGLHALRMVSFLVVKINGTKTMKSKLIAGVFLACLVTTPLLATRTDVGTWNTGVSFMLDASSFYGTDVTLDLSLGQYIETGMMLGGYLSFGDNDLITTVSGGATGKYHFFDNGQTAFSPYVGGDLGLAYCSTARDDVYALVIGARLGFDFFLTENVALDVAVDFHVATDDIYSDDDGLTSTDATFKVGLAFFF